MRGEHVSGPVGCYSNFFLLLFFFSYFCLCTLRDQTNLQSKSNLINVELLNQIQISAFSTQMPLRHRLHALLLQAVHHIIERILVRQRCKSLGKEIRGYHADQIKQRSMFSTQMQLISIPYWWGSWRRPAALCLRHPSHAGFPWHWTTVSSLENTHTQHLFCLYIKYHKCSCV